MSSESDNEISRNKEMMERCVCGCVCGCIYVSRCNFRVISVLPPTVDGLYIQGLEEAERLEEVEEEEEEDKMNNSKYH